MRLLFLVYTGIHSTFCLMFSEYNRTTKRLGGPLLAGDCEQAIRLNPNFARAYYNQGDVLLDLGRREEAEQAYQKGRELSQ